LVASMAARFGRETSSSSPPVTLCLGGALAAEDLVCENARAIPGRLQSGRFREEPALARSSVKRMGSFGVFVKFVVHLRSSRSHQTIKSGGFSRSSTISEGVGRVVRPESLYTYWYSQGKSDLGNQTSANPCPPSGLVDALLERERAAKSESILCGVGIWGLAELIEMRLRCCSLTERDSF